MARARTASNEGDRGTTPADVIVRVLRVSPYLTPFGRDLSRSDPRYPPKQSEMVQRWKAQRRGMEHKSGKTRNLAPPPRRLPTPATQPEPQPGPRRRLAGWLSAMTGDITGESYALHLGYNNIGRAEGQDILLRRDPAVAESHARIRVDPNGAWLYDLSSGGGTAVDGHRLQDGGRAPLPSGAKLQIGTYELVLTLL